MVNNTVNQITLHGKIRTVQKSSFTNDGKEYWQFFMIVERQSGHTDTLPVIVLSETLGGMKLRQGLEITVVGNVCAQSSSEIRKESHLQVYVYAYKIIEEFSSDTNEVVLEGCIKKKPTYRETKTGIKICDLMIQTEINRKIPIPCLVWDARAQIAASHNPGDRVRIKGMLQRRIFRKETGEGTIVRYYYEVSVYRSEFI